MGKQIGETKPLPPDDPMFKRGLILVPVRRSAPSRATSASDTDGSPMQPVGDAIEAYLQGLRSPSSREPARREKTAANHESERAKAFKAALTDAIEETIGATPELKKQMIDREFHEARICELSAKIRMGGGNPDYDRWARALVESLEFMAELDRNLNALGPFPRSDSEEA